MNPSFMKKAKIIDFFATLLAIIIVVGPMFMPASIAKADGYDSWIRNVEGNDNDGMGSLKLKNAGNLHDSDDSEVELLEQDKNPDPISKTIAGFWGYMGTAIRQGFKAGGIDASITGIIMGNIKNNVSLFVFDLTDNNIYGIIGAVIYVAVRAIFMIFLFLSTLLKVILPIWKGDSRGGSIIKEALLSFVISLLLIVTMPLIVDWICVARDKLSIIIYNATDAFIAKVSGYSATSFNLSRVTLGAIGEVNISPHLADTIEGKYYEAYAATPNFVNAIIYLAVCLLPIGFLANYIKVAFSQTILFGMYPMFAFMGSLDENGSSSKQWVVTFVSNCFIPSIDMALIFVPCFVIALIDSMTTELEVVQQSNSIIKAIIVVVMFFGIIPTRNILLGLLGNTFGRISGSNSFAGLLATVGATAASAISGLSDAVKDYRAGGSDSAIGDNAKEKDLSDVSEKLDKKANGPDESDSKMGSLESNRADMRNNELDREEERSNAANGDGNNAGNGNNEVQPEIPSNTPQEQPQIPDVDGGAGSGEAAEASSVKDTDGDSQIINDDSMPNSGAFDERAVENIPESDTYNDPSESADMGDSPAPGNNDNIDADINVDDGTTSSFDASTSAVEEAEKEAEAEVRELSVGSSDLSKAATLDGEKIDKDGETSANGASSSLDNKQKTLADRIKDSSFKDSNVDHTDFNMSRAANLKSMENMNTRVGELNKDNRKLASGNAKLQSKIAEKQAELSSKGYIQSNDGSWKSTSGKELGTTDMQFIRTKQAEIANMQSEISKNNAQIGVNNARKEVLNSEVSRRQNIEGKFAEAYASTGRTDKVFSSSEELANHLETEKRMANIANIENYATKDVSGYLSTAQRTQFERQAAKRELNNKIVNMAATAAGAVALAPVAMAMAVGSEGDLTESVKLVKKAAPVVGKTVKKVGGAASKPVAAVVTKAGKAIYNAPVGPGAVAKAVKETTASSGVSSPNGDSDKKQKPKANDETTLRRRDNHPEDSKPVGKPKAKSPDQMETKPAQKPGEQSVNTPHGDKNGHSKGGKKGYGNETKTGYDNRNDKPKREEVKSLPKEKKDKYNKTRDNILAAMNSIPNGGTDLDGHSREYWLDQLQKLNKEYGL